MSNRARWALRHSPLLGLLLAGSAPAQTPEQRFFDWTEMQFPASEYADRRDRMVGRLRASGGGVFLVPGGDGRSGGETFRPSADFLYFTGLELPNSVLAVDADRDRVVLFLPRRDPRFESPDRRNDFPGRPLGDDPTLRARSGIQDMRPRSSLDAFLDSLSSRGATIRINLERPGAADPGRVSIDRPPGIGEHLLDLITNGGPFPVENAFESVARLRMVKSPAEVAAMRRTAEVTVAGIRVAAGFVRDGVDERTLEGELEAEFKRRGAQRVAFASIIKSGPNSLWPWRVLASHYDRRNRAMRDGDLVIFDVGAELDYYSSDVGRTFPVSGIFSQEQREILQMEVRVADAIIGAVRPGITLRELQRVGHAAIPVAHRQFMQTGLFFGHHIGLSVGDPALPDVPLEPGMIFTVEPWYYNHEREISVFTEDEILVTESGAEILTAALPRTPDALEAMVGVRPDRSRDVQPNY